VDVKTDDERWADVLVYYYRNRDLILEKKRKERERKKDVTPRI
jgi:hypothetical protein